MVGELAHNNVVTYPHESCGIHRVDQDQGIIACSGMATARRGPDGGCGNARGRPAVDEVLRIGAVTL